jgi:hypothetical protein
MLMFGCENKLGLEVSESTLLELGGGVFVRFGVENAGTGTRELRKEGLF